MSRLDVVVAKRFGISRTAAQKAIAVGRVRLAHVEEPLRAALEIDGDDPSVEIFLEPEQAQLTAATATVESVGKQFTFEILFENDQVLVINKPAGLVVHSGIGVKQGTLAHLLIARNPELATVGVVGGFARCGIVHRLDKDTSGVMIIAKTDTAFHLLQEQFAARAAKKTYLALVLGAVKQDVFESRDYLARSTRDPRKRSVVRPEHRGARLAEAEFVVRSRSKDLRTTLVEVHPRTGRTHQIRVQLAHYGNPIMGDALYAAHPRRVRHKEKTSELDAPRQLLHAWKLQIQIPDEHEPRTFEAALPEDFLVALAKHQLTL